jgi:hypothetical protein
MSDYKYIIDKYTFFMMEYIHLLNTSEIVKNAENKNHILAVGIKALIHVFKICLLITETVDTTAAYAQRGAYCYLEYVEQTYKSGLSGQIDTVDAIQFVYGRTINEIYGPQNNTQIATITNVLSLKENMENATQRQERRILLQSLEKITNTLLWPDHLDITNTERLRISFRHLQNFLCLAVQLEKIVPDNHFICFITTIQEHVLMSYAEYSEILDEYYKHAKKWTRQTQPIESSLVHNKLLHIAVLHSGKSLAEIVELEGYKKKTDLVKWFFSFHT